MSLEKDKIPKEMLIDIIRVFLFGKEGYTSPDGRMFNYIRHLNTDICATWEDLFDIRNVMLRILMKSPDHKFNLLGNLLFNIHKPANDYQI